MYELFADMLKFYASNPHVSDTDFWIMANETISTSNMPLIQVLDNQRALGIQVNWISYLKQCDPVYCDVVTEVSFTAKCGNWWLWCPFADCYPEDFVAVTSNCMWVAKYLRVFVWICAQQSSQA